MNAVKDTNSMELLLKQSSMMLPKIGDIIEGRVLIQEGNRIYFDLGNFRTGIIYGREFYLAKNTIKGLKPGELISAKVVDIENDEGFIELSLAQAGLDINWQKIIALRDQKVKLKLKIEEANRGGLIATIERQKAFLPVSQLSSQHYPRVEEGDKEKILVELNKFVGQELEVRVIGAEPEQNKLIVSEKAALDEMMNEIISQYKLGDVIEGEISGITDFGAFMKFAPVKGSNVPLEGLIHISELDWQLIEDPHNVVQVGQKVAAKIIAIENGRLSLSLKALKKDSWDGIEEKYKKGDVVQGTLMKFNPFGAFIKLEENIHGLCHISEFGSEKNMREMLEADKNYPFKIVSIEPKEHRMSLSFMNKPASSQETEKEKTSPKEEKIDK